MDSTMIDAHLENIDRRLTSVAQILPTLATKDELREESERLRRHMDILTESLRGDIRLIAAHVASATSKRPGS